MNEWSDLTVASESRLDHFLRQSIPHLSVRNLRHLAETGSIRVNGRLARKGSRVRAGDVVNVPSEIVATTTLRAQPEIQVPILFQDEHVIGIDKPSEMPSIARTVLDTGTAANFLVGRFPETLSLDRRGLEAGIVHRLDTATSGVLIAARDSTSHRALTREFRGGDARKTYRAVVEGTIRTPGEVRDLIRGKPGDPSRVEVVAPGTTGGQPAQTGFEPISSINGFTLLKVEIRSGARHQIRAHLASIGHPIVGDQLYGDRVADRLALHAYSVDFNHPISGQPVAIKAQPPVEFTRIWQVLSGESSPEA